MTCIVGLKTLRGTVIMGADSRATMGDGVSIHVSTASSKIFVVPPYFLFASSGAVRTKHINSSLKISLVPQKDFNLELCLLNDVIPQLKTIARRYEFLKMENGMARLHGVTLVACGGQMCIIGSDFSTVPVDGDFWAIGSGAEVALGSLYSTKKLLSPLERVKIAIEAASEFIQSVGGPSIIKETQPFPTFS